MNELIVALSSEGDKNIALMVEELITDIHRHIPEKKRVSYGRYNIVKRLGKAFYGALKESTIDADSVANMLFENHEADPFVRSLGVQITALMAVERGPEENLLARLEKAADHSEWIVRECSQGYVKQVVKTYPQEMLQWYLKLVVSSSANTRRFVSESLRPVTDNRWMVQEPSYPLSILSHLFEEHDPYPRTSVGNNLSDWFRVNEDVAWPIVEKLAKSSNKDSQWIAYRACRNVVKKDTERVLQMLGLTEYRYKGRTYSL